ncbi:MAG: sodium-dependent transporter [Cellulosilyticaceae bacterium]
MSKISIDVKNNKVCDFSVQTRDGFNSKAGFVLACIGSAVGMGNIWLFPYRVGQCGGAAFLIPYFIFLIGIGFVGVIGEMTLGRSMRNGPLGAFSKATKMRGSKIGEILGMIPVIGSLGVAIGYSVVVGWVIRFLVGAVSGSMFEKSTQTYFETLAGNFGSVFWHMLGLAITFGIMVVGIAKGIEKLNLIMIPAFYVLFVILAIRVFTLPGAKEGYRYLLVPEWEMLLEPKTWIYALGMSFFSLSLAGSGTVVYGSYLKDTEDIPSCAKNVTIFGGIAAMLCACVIIPAVFAFELDPTAGPALMFITMPNVFKAMPMGRLFAIVFFVAVLFAALTSLVNLFETSVEALQAKFNLSRKLAVSIIATIAVVVGIFIESADSVGKWMDIASIYIIPLGALLAAIMLYWVAGPKFARENAQKGRKEVLGKWFEPMTKYIFVGFTLLVYIMGIIYGGIG